MLAELVNDPVLVNATACESDIKDELFTAEAVRFGALTANVEVVLLPIAPVETRATVLAATGV